MASKSVSIDPKSWIRSSIFLDVFKIHGKLSL